MVVENTVERSVHSIIDKVHEKGRGLRGCRRGNLTLADDVHGECVRRTGKETT